MLLINTKVQILICFFCSSFIFAQVPVQQEPYHRPVYQDGEIRILEVKLAPGDTSLFHRHDHNIFYCTLHGTRMWLQKENGKSRVAKLPTGWMGDDTAYHINPLVHRIANIGRDSLSLLAVESLGKPGRVLRKDPANNWEINDSVFSAKRIILPPGGKQTFQINSTGVLINMNSGILRIEKGVSEKIRRKWYVFSGNGPYYAYNAGQDSLRLVWLKINHMP